jgi:hypothetical protein
MIVLVVFSSSCNQGKSYFLSFLYTSLLVEKEIIELRCEGLRRLLLERANGNANDTKKSNASSSCKSFPFFIDSPYTTSLTAFSWSLHEDFNYFSYLENTCESRVK